VVTFRKIKSGQYLRFLLYKIRFALASLQLQVVASCHKHLTDLIDLFYPQLPPAEDPACQAAREFAEWTPTTQPIFAVVPPNHIIRGPGETRKLRS
jgi:hypothetical protein